MSFFRGRHCAFGLYSQESGKSFSLFDKISPACAPKENAFIRASTSHRLPCLRGEVKRQNNTACQVLSAKIEGMVFGLEDCEMIECQDFFFLAGLK